MARRWLLGGAVSGVLWATGAGAETASVPRPYAYGVIVGSNTGGPGQQTLHYAEDDAQRVATVLREVGRFGTTDLRVLVHPSGAQVLQSIDEIGVKVREHAQRGEQAVVVFYYSGHAKANAFTFGADELPLATLRDRLRALPATLTLVVLDACQSGAFARTKGTEPAADFSFNSVSRLTTKGIAVMASSTGQELSQESDALKSSYFTHHLVVALRGAGDADGDGKVSLDEAYRYAYRRTLSATARTRVGSQHVTLEMDLSGQGDVPVTYPAEAKSQLELPESLDARVLVQDSRNGSVAAELQKAPGAALKLALPQGAYDATIRLKSSQVYGCKLQLFDGKVAAIDLGQCQAIVSTGIPKGFEDDAQPEADVPATEAPSTAQREIDRWGIEGSAGLLWRTSDAFTDTLGTFAYQRDKGVVDLPSGRFSLGATRLLVPHVTLLVQAQTLAGDAYSSDVSGIKSTYSWKGYGAGAYVRVHGDVLPRLLQAYAQLGGGGALATSALENASGKYSDVSFGYLLGVAGGVAVVADPRVGVFLQGGYDRAPALANRIGDRHDVGGPSVSAGVRLNFGRGQR
jgi:hypothetical protein